MCHKFTSVKEVTIVIVVLMLLAYIFIASEHVTHINKAATAMFAGVVGWILYMCMGTDFVYRMHESEFSQFLAGAAYSAGAAQEFIATHVFVHYSAYIGSIVLYLLTTMSIVDVLSNNGCFDFITVLLRVRDTNRILWGFVLITFIISANFDNLTTAVLMLVLMRRLLSNERQRRYVGSCIVIAACCGGCFTVIGDVTSLMVWAKEAVTPSDFSASLVLPALIGTAIPTLLIRQSLPEHLDLNRSRVIFRGDDTSMPLWQKLVMLVLGMVGLWFVPSFHRITLLPPFMGSVCVLGIIWMLNEIFNSRSIRSEQPMLLPGSDRRLHYEVLQVIMFFMGVALAISVLVEIGAMDWCSRWLDRNIHDIYILSLFMGVVSSFLDNVCLVLSAINVYDVFPSAASASAYQQLFMQNGQYWHLVVISGCLGGCLLPIGNTAGYAFMRSEDTSIWWYVRNISLKVLLGWIGALVAYFVIDYFVR